MNVGLSPVQQALIRTQSRIDSSYIADSGNRIGVLEYSWASPEDHSVHTSRVHGRGVLVGGCSPRLGGLAVLISGKIRAVRVHRGCAVRSESLSHHREGSEEEKVSVDRRINIVEGGRLLLRASVRHCGQHVIIPEHCGRRRPKTHVRILDHQIILLVEKVETGRKSIGRELVEMVLRHRVVVITHKSQSFLKILLDLRVDSCDIPSFVLRGESGLRLWHVRDSEISGAGLLVVLQTEHIHEDEMRVGTAEIGLA